MSETTKRIESLSNELRDIAIKAQKEYTKNCKYFGHDELEESLHQGYLAITTHLHKNYVPKSEVKGLQVKVDVGEIEETIRIGIKGMLANEFCIHTIESASKEIAKAIVKRLTRKELLRQATKGLPQWYKDKLAKESFKNESL